MPELTPAESAAEEYAALTALKAGLDDVIADAKSRALAALPPGMTRASWATAYGPVNVTTSAEGVSVDPAGLLAMVEAHYPDEVIVTRSVRPSFAAAFTASLRVIAGQVIHADTGEVVDFAKVKPAGRPTLSYPSSLAQRDAKELARMLFDENRATLTDSLRELTR